MKIAIIGAGVNGLSAAVKIAEYYYDKPNVQITLISDKITPNTTGDGSAGLWGPYLYGNTPVENIFKWSKETHDFFSDLWRNGLANEAGLCLQPTIRVTLADGGFPVKPFWHDIVYGLKKLNEIELTKLSDEHGKKYTGAYHFVTFTCEPIRLLPYLYKRFAKAGGQFQNKKIENFDELASYDAVVNCTGLSGKYLSNDSEVSAIRGQVARIDAPWLFYTFLDESDGNYIIPNINSVVLGGTHQVNDFNTNVSEEDSAFIFDGCTRMIPSIRNAKVLREWVGLRPGRTSVRLEKEIYHTKSGSDIIIIHNYGHGGCGVTMAWGCATNVLDILKNHFDLKSKL